MKFVMELGRKLLTGKLRKIADIPCDIHKCSNFLNFQMVNQEGIQFE